MKRTRRLATILGVVLGTAAVTAVAQESVRTEKDLLGERKVPAEALYGVQTARAIENFPISGIPIGAYPEFVDALVEVKIAAARANAALGTLDPKKRDLIERAGKAVLDGKYRDQFAVDWYQGGAGTSSNMNANEVLANLALELSGRPRGDYAAMSPNDDLNASQSTNDVFPTALKLAFLKRNDVLVRDVQALADAFRRKGSATLRIVKMGRTELQDAVPMTVGQELHAFADALETEAANLRQAERALYAVNMGGTAIGTGLNAPPGFPKRVAAELATITGKPIVPAKDLVAATWNLHGFEVYASALESLAVTLSKIASDLILLASGPRAGLNELRLPELQPGSSIMPGKVNPVMPELVNLVAFRVMGNAAAVTHAARTGQLQLNAYEPLVGIATLESQKLLSNTVVVFRERCVDGITVNESQLERHIAETVGIVTALVPVIGYKQSSELAREAYQSGKGVLELVREKKLLTEEQIRQVLDPEKLTGLDPAAYPAAPKGATKP